MPPFAIDPLHPHTRVQVNAVVAIPVVPVEHDAVERLFARKDRRQQDAVVVGLRFGAEDGDRVEIGRDLQQFFDGAHARHAVADHDEPLPLRLGEIESHFYLCALRQQAPRRDLASDKETAARARGTRDRSGCAPSPADRAAGQLHIEDFSDHRRGSVGHHHDAIGEQYRLVDVVRDHQHGRAGGRDDLP